jgi:GntR family transcriptional repressor for pyruvate dehydrogenase complex
MTVFNKLDRVPLPEQIAGEIEEAIIAGKFAVGTLLPSEQQLADQFGVSRNVIREAFKVLKERGLIRIQTGAAAMVVPPDSRKTSTALWRYLRMQPPRNEVEALYEIRRLLEGEAARLAAQRIHKLDLDYLWECIERMARHAGNIKAWSDADLDFHIGVAVAAQNPLFRILLFPLVEQLRDVIQEGYAEPGAAERGLEAHRQIFDRIRHGDTEGAYQAMLNHLHDSQERVARLHARRASSIQQDQ